MATPVTWYKTYANVDKHVAGAGSARVVHVRSEHGYLDGILDNGTPREWDVFRQSAAPVEQQMSRCKT